MLPPPTTLASSPPATQARRLRSLVVGSLVLSPPPSAAREGAASTCVVAKVCSRDARPRSSRPAATPYTQPPPPPAFLPPNFVPAFLGRAPARDLDLGGSRSGAASAWSTPVTDRDLRCSTTVLHVPAGILRASNASATARPVRRTVSFDIPAPRCHNGEPSPVSLRPRPCPAPRPPTAGDSRSPSPAAGWIRVLSRRARMEARRTVLSHQARYVEHRTTRRDSSLLSSRAPSHSSPPTHRPHAPHRHPRSSDRRPRPCFRCQATDHFVATCRDPVRCAGCRRWGHRERDCVEPPRPRQFPVGSPSPPRRRQLCSPAPPPRPTPPALPIMHVRTMAFGSNRDRERARERSPRHHGGGSDRHECRHASLSVAPSVRPASLPQQNAAPVSPLPSFVDELLACPEMDVCCTTSTWVVLANETCYKVSVDGALSEENERAGIGRPGRHTLLSPSAGLTMVLFSPGNASCKDGLSSEDEEAETDGEMQQLLPCLAEPGLQGMLLDDEEVAHEDGLDNDGDSMLLGFQPVADDANAEAAALGSLLAVDVDDVDVDDAADAGGSARSSGTGIRSVADLFSLPAVPLLPTPLPLMQRDLVVLPTPDRCSSRLAKKPQLPVADKALHVLLKKMGLDVGEMPLVKARKEFANTCKSPLSSSAIEGLNTLFRFNLPSMTAVDEALIGLAGPGGSDFPPPTALDVSA